jgi:hypothetical protein
LHDYVYAHGDPVNNTDPSGRETLTNLKIASAIIGVLTASYYYSQGDAPEDAAAKGAIAGLATFMTGFITIYGITAVPIMALTAKGSLAAQALAQVAAQKQAQLKEEVLIQESTRFLELIQTRYNNGGGGNAISRFLQSLGPSLTARDREVLRFLANAAETAARSLPYGALKAPPGANQQAFRLFDLASRLNRFLGPE